MSRGSTWIPLVLALILVIAVVGIAIRFEPAIGRPNDLAQLIDRADKVVVLASPWQGSELLFESSDPRDLLALKDAMQVDPPIRYGARCMCAGAPAIFLYADGESIGTITNHHAHVIRCNIWNSDAHILNVQAYVKWFDDRGITGPRNEYEEARKQVKQSQEESERFDRHFPGEVKNFRNGQEVALAVCRAFGTLKGSSPSWTQYSGAGLIDEEYDPADGRGQFAAVKAIKKISGDEFLAALGRLKEDRIGLEGAARMFFQERLCDKLPQEARPEWTVRLAKAALVDGWDGNKPQVLRHLSYQKHPKIEAFLLDVFQGNVGKEVAFTENWGDEPGIRAGAALGLSLLHNDSIKADVGRLRAHTTARQDIAAFEVCLALLGEPKRVKKEHFQMSSGSIGFAGVRAIEDHKAEHGLMEVLVEGALHHPWGSVSTEAEQAFQRITRHNWDRHEIEDWWEQKKSGKARAQPLVALGDKTNPLGWRVAFHPNGELVACGNKEPVSVFDLGTGKRIRQLQGHTRVTCAVAFSANGKQLASGNVDQTIRLWDTVTGKEIKTLTGHMETVDALAFSHDGKQLASGGNRSVKVWDVETGRVRWEFEFDESGGGIGGLAFAPDGGRIVCAGSCGYGVVNVWDLSNGGVVLTVKQKGGAHTAALSPDGTQLASATGNTVEIRDVTTGKEIMTFNGHNELVLSVAFGPDGKRLASGGWGKTVKVWDARTGQEHLSFKAHVQNIVDVAFSPNGQRLATVGMEGTVKIWDITKLLEFEGQ